ncbi:uncharacterized protein LOC129917091 [Episyrphus balteatus]|uniref:uncharacterized protein LOC129917091 n=1 Tax=Episyrphus balteatus TaxID=286459 RepID=UPI002485B888|nr:uncharacterized protein LOC129917091 [Episyrphus balteatus]
MKTMKMNKQTDKNSAGIYAKKSTGITTVGDGLAFSLDEDVKSPVIKIKRLKTKDISNENKNIKVINDSKENEKENQDIKEENENNDTLSKTDVLECDASNALIDDDVIIVTEPTTVIVLDSEDENDKSHEDSEIQNQEPEHHIDDDKNGESHQDHDNQNVEESEHHIDDNNSNLKVDSQNKNVDVENSNKKPFKQQGTSSVVGSSAPKTPLNQKILEFPMCKSRYGSDRYDKAIKKLQEIGYITWEVNTMFGALEKYFIKRFGKRPIPQQDLRRFKKPRLDDDQSKEKQSEPETISGVLVDNGKTYVTFDLRANIGDANHPNFHILPQNMDALYVELVRLLQEQKWMPLQPFIACSYINQTLMVECKNEQILTYIVKNISMLNRRFTGADFVLIPRSCERKTILIYIPYSYLDVAVVLDIIKKQNKLPVDEWKVNSSEKWQEGICLDVEVDGGSYLRLIQDQDDVFFLMKKATIRLPPDVDES